MWGGQTPAHSTHLHNFSGLRLRHECCVVVSKDQRTWNRNSGSSRSATSSRRMMVLLRPPVGALRASRGDAVLQRVQGAREEGQGQQSRPRQADDHAAPWPPTGLEGLLPKEKLEELKRAGGGTHQFATARVDDPGLVRRARGGERQVRGARGEHVARRPPLLGPSRRRLRRRLGPRSCGASARSRGSWPSARARPRSTSSTRPA